MLSKPRKSLPNLVTDEPVCPEGQLQCGDGNCMDKLLFCDGKVRRWSNQHDLTETL